MKKRVATVFILGSLFVSAASDVFAQSVSTQSVSAQTWNLPQGTAVNGPIYSGVRCPAASADFCVFAEETAYRRHLIFNAFDPIKGRGPELTRFPYDSNEICNWTVSQDGKAIAIEGYEENTIHVVYLNGRPQRDITVKGWPDFNSVDFTADNTGFFVNSVQREEAHCCTSIGRARPILCRSGNRYF